MKETNERDSPMKLVQPTDFLILEALEEHGRNVPTNLGIHIDRQSEYVSNRLPQLADYGLVMKVGPANRSGLYEITEKGRVALRFKDEYGEVEDFEELVEENTED